MHASRFHSGPGTIMLVENLSSTGAIESTSVHVQIVT